MDSDAWAVDSGGVRQYCDADGWSYGFNMTAFQSFDSLGTKVCKRFNVVIHHHYYGRTYFLDVLFDNACTPNGQ